MYTTRNRFVMFFLTHAFGAWYILYWIYSVQNEIQYHERKKENGLSTALLVFVTFGIYAFVWQWKVCSTLKKQGAGDLRVVTLILGILGIGIIINPLLIQGEINGFKNRVRNPLY